MSGEWNRAIGATGGTAGVARGTAYLVGAGPGSADLITLRGLEVLRTADVVLYDRLVAPALVGEAPPHAERICVGKSRGKARLGQEAIERLMAQRAAAGKTVVRLKGGDPFVFGRGGEEALALRQAGIPFEVVPGITSAVAVPAAAGIPVTHRGVSGAFAVWTASRSPGEDAQVVDAPTQVILMGLATLEETANRLIASGRAAETPAAVISWGATARQRAIFGTLADIAARAYAAGISSPATVVVGDVVRIGEALASACDPLARGGSGPAGDAAPGRDPASFGEAAPGDYTGPSGAPADEWTRLFCHRRVALSRKAEKDPLVRRLEAAGAEAAPLPFFVLRAAPHPEFDATIERLGKDGGFTQAAFADEYGVREAMQRLEAAGRDARSLAGVRIVALSESAERALRALGIVPDGSAIDSTEPAAVIEGVRGAAPAFLAEGARARRVHAGEEEPAVQVIRSLFDMALEAMIDAVLFDSRRAWEAAQALLQDLDPADREKLARFPAYVADGDRLLPLPLTGGRYQASEELTV